jgi:hypothetical protein
LIPSLGAHSDRFLNYELCERFGGHQEQNARLFAGRLFQVEAYAVAKNIDLQPLPF